MLQFKDNFLFTKKPKIYGFFFFLKFSSFLNTQIEPNQILTYQACNFCTKQTQEYLSRCKHVQDMFVNRLTKFFLEIQNIIDLLKMMPYHCLRFSMIPMKFHFMFSYHTPYRIESMERRFVWHSSYFLTFAIITNHRQYTL